MAPSQAPEAATAAADSSAPPIDVSTVPTIYRGAIPPELHAILQVLISDTERIQALNADMAQLNAGTLEQLYMMQNQLDDLYRRRGGFYRRPITKKADAPLPDGVTSLHEWKKGKGA